MSELRPFALVRSGDQWARCSHDATFLDVASGVVELAWTSEADAAVPSPAGVAGLAFDAHCRLLHALPAAGRVERLRWAAIDPAAPAGDQPAAVDLFADAPPPSFGDFGPTATETGLLEPRGLAVDANDRLFVAETAADDILVFDLWEQRLLQRTAVAAGARPTDLAAQGSQVLAVLAAAAQVVRLGARSTPVPVPLPPGCTAPSRVALSPGGQVAVLAAAGTATARVWFTAAGWPDFAVPCATDLEWESEDVLVIARSPGADFLRMRVGRGLADGLSPLRARGYDGAGIVALPASGIVAARRIGFWTARGPRAAVAARVVYERRGRVTTYRLDSGNWQTEWGRVFVDACIPPGAEVRMACLTADDTEGGPEFPRSAPANLVQLTLRRPDLSPPMPPLADVPGPGAVVQPLHRRESGRERPWTQPGAGDPFETYEAPVIAGPGRYLWLTLELRGNTRVSPKLRCVRAEHPVHDYLRRLPRTFARDAAAAAFLQRYLAMFEGLLGETEARAVDRDLLLEPRTAPPEVLPWLASFLGLVLDERWAQAPAPAGQPPLDVRREYIAQAAWLFRFRGTLPGLKRFIEIYTRVPVVILEHYRLRGLGAVVLGDADVAAANSVVGYGFRVGGEVGTEVETPISGSVADAFRTHAHRFTVIIPAALDAEQVGVVERILQVHRPAHTLFDLCTVDAGMRLGIGLLLEVSSVIGRSGGFGRVQLGASALGRTSLLGRPAAGGRLGSAALGAAMQVG